VTNAGAKPGDILVLTKAIGTGIITTAAKSSPEPPAALAGAVESMCALNRGASEAMVSVGVNAATDITGFGLLGHLHTMMTASGVSARIRRSAVPVLPGVAELMERGFMPGGTVRNAEAVAHAVSWSTGVSDADKLLLADAQTSGGLLISVPRAKVAALQKELKKRGAPFAAVIGEVTTGETGHILVGK
jgi:selenide,water dikinase